MVRLAATETLFYCIFAAIGTSMLCAGGLAIVAPVALWWGAGAALDIARKAMAFAAILVVCGIPANIIFVAALRDRVYVAADPIVDWLPWVPSGDWVLDVACGGHYIHGASAWTLRVAWAVLALPTWALAIHAYRRLMAP